MAKNQKLESASAIAMALAAGNVKAKNYQKVDVQYVDEPTIAIPRGMSIPKAIDWLGRVQKEQEAVVGFNHEIDCLIQDGLVAFNAVLRSTWGIVESVIHESFFGRSAPTMLSIRTGPKSDDFVQVPWGQLRVPGMSDDEYMNLGYSVNGGRPRLVIHGEIKRKNEPLMAELATLVANYVRTNSIYRGQALRLDLEWLVNPRQIRFDPSTHTPIFWDVSTIDPNQLILNPDVDADLQANLYGFVRNSDAYLANNEPLSTGVVLAGDYGTGKSLAGSILAHHASRNNWTFLYLENPSHLAAALRIADIYETGTRGTVVYVEDIDRVTGQRDDAMNDILNTLSGVDRAKRKTIVVMTTNHASNIHGAMMRAGRTDSLIQFRYPEGPTTIRFVSQYGGPILAPDQDYTELSRLLSGYPPAFIEGVVRRARRLAISQFGADIAGKVTAEMLEVSARGYANHVKMAQVSNEQELNPNAPVFVMISDDDEPLSKVLRTKLAGDASRAYQVNGPALA